MTDEANIAEAELAEAIWIAAKSEEVYGLLTILDTQKVARALLAAGYRKRSDVLEEAAKACEQLRKDTPHG